MNKLFLATSFSGHIDYDNGGIVIPEYRTKIEASLEALRKTGGYTVFCAVEHEGWRIKPEEGPEVGVQVDLDEIEQSDVFLALLPDGVISGGLQYEAGFADGLKKQVILATGIGEKLIYWNEGVVNLGRASHVEYDSPETLVSGVQQILG